jgi:transposase-like protein
MHIIDRAKQFLLSLKNLANRTAWDWRRCPYCGDTDTCKHGFYTRHPWFLEGRQAVQVQRHRCYKCRRTYSEQFALLVRGGWYAREVRRYTIDQWQHGGESLRRAAEFTRSLLGKQERWHLWRPLDPNPYPSERCYLVASSVHRWLDAAGKEAKRTVNGQLSMIETSGQVGTDGLWARLRGKAKRVVLVLVDNVTGIVWPPVVVKGEESRQAWRKLFIRARLAGLKLDALRGVTSDGAKGLMGYLSSKLEWLNHQACVWHIWRSLGGEIAAKVNAATAGLSGQAAKVARQAVREEIVELVGAVMDARSEAAAFAALATLKEHKLGEGLAEEITKHIDRLFVHLRNYNSGLVRVAPEWLWRDFRLRLGRGRNHGSDERLERAVLVWAIYRNFTPAQRRSERKRKYRHPGMSPLEVAGHPPQNISYLDALAV